MNRLARMVVIGVGVIGALLASSTTAFAQPSDLQPNQGGVQVMLNSPPPDPYTKFHIHNMSDAVNKCVGISGYQAGNWDCADGPDQRWHTTDCLAWVGEQFCHYVNDNGQCLAVAGGSTANAALIWGWNCVYGQAAANQYWRAAYEETSGLSHLANMGTYLDGMVLGVWGGSTDNGARLVQYKQIPGAMNQYWSLY